MTTTTEINEAIRAASQASDALKEAEDTLSARWRAARLAQLVLIEAELWPEHGDEAEVARAKRDLAIAEAEVAAKDVTRATGEWLEARDAVHAMCPSLTQSLGEDARA